MPLIAKQLNDDLGLIDKAIDRVSDVEGAKRILKEIVEWNRSHVEAVGAIDERLRIAEDVLDETEEGISMESGQVIMLALEQSRHVASALRSIITSEGNPLDDVSTKQLLTVLKNAETQVGLAMQLVGDLVVVDEDGGEDDDGGEDEGEEDGGDGGDTSLLGEDEDDGEDEEEAARG